MIKMDEASGFGRRGAAAVMGVAAAAALAGLPLRKALAEQDTPWNTWLKSYYGRPIKIAMSCYNTTNPYFVPTKVGAQDAGAQLGIDLQWTGVPDANTVNQIAQFQQRDRPKHGGDHAAMRNERRRRQMSR